MVDRGTTWERNVDDEGEFVREATRFHEWVRKDRSTAFAPQHGRYHLYVSLACPWAHRTLIVRELKGLKQTISVDVVDHLLPADGWTFKRSTDAATGDRVNRFETLREVYLQADPAYSGTVTVPVLWDKYTGTIVNNESSEIIRMLNGEFQDYARHPDLDLYPPALRAEIDAVNEWVYRDINNGVYRSGFARSQRAHDRAVQSLFAALDRVESILSESRYLCGERLTEADVRLFPTLVRFDSVYATHFKCNLRRIVDYPNLWEYTRELYQMPGIAETVNMEHIKRHYFESHDHINPFRIVPRGPILDFTQPHDRAAREYPTLSNSCSAHIA